MSYFNPVQLPVLCEYLLVIHFNIIVLCTPISPKSSYFPTEIMEVIFSVLVLYSKPFIFVYFLCM